MELQKVYKVVDVSIASYGVANILIANGETKVVEPTDAILLTKEDAEKIKETENMLLKRIEWCDKKIELLMGALEANNIPEPMLNDLNK